MSANIVKPITSGVMGATGTYLKYPTATMRVAGRDVPLFAATGVALAVGSGLAEIAHDYIFPQIHALEKLSEPVSATVSAGIAGSATVGTFYLSNPQAVDDIGLPMLLAYGAGIDAASQYITEKFIAPMLA